MDVGFDTEALDPADAYQQNWEACGRIGAENLRKNLEKALTCAKKRSSVRMIFELCALFLFTITYPIGGKFAKNTLNLAGIDFSCGLAATDRPPAPSPLRAAPAAPPPLSRPLLFQRAPWIFANSKL